MQINVTVILPCKRKAKSTKLPSIYRGFITEKKRYPIGQELQLEEMPFAPQIHIVCKHCCHVYFNHLVFHLKRTSYKSVLKY